MRPLEPIPLAEIRAARERLVGIALRTPLIPLYHDGNSETEIYLKLENLQPIGSFKLRGSGNAIACADEKSLANGVYTASAGNMAQGVAWNARRLGIDCTVIVPDHAPQTKLDAITRLGGKIIAVPMAEWWQILVDHHYPGQRGVFIHPVSDPAVIAGNGTVALEIIEDLPDVDAVVVPYGGGGLSSGIASALRELRPQTKVFASEVVTAAPLAASLKVGKAQQIDYQPSFVDGIGGSSVLVEMWPMVQQLLADSIVVSLEEVAAAIRLLIGRARIVAEGAGASSVAAALTGKAGSGKLVCVISGGNIDSDKLAMILRREL